MYFVFLHNGNFNLTTVTLYDYLSDLYAATRADISRRHTANPLLRQLLSWYTGSQLSSVDSSVNH